MVNFHADKARGFLNLAETQRAELKKEIQDAHDGLRISPSYEEKLLSMLATSNLVAEAQVHATLATAHENETFEVPETEQAEAPKDPNEPGQGAQDPTVLFFDSLDDTLAFLRSIRPVADLLRGPRPVKDTPQA